MNSLKKSLLGFLVLLALGLFENTWAYGNYESCYMTYGFGAQDNFDGTCSCMSGYGFGVDIMGKKQCISMNTLCTDQYGYGAKAVGDSCACRYGYAFEKNIGGAKCVMQTCGLYSSFDDDIKQCVCNEGYTMVEGTFGTRACEKKAYSTYAVLNEYKNDEAIVTYAKPNGSLTRSKITTYSCYMAENYVGKVVVVNLMKDEMLNTGDYLILDKDNVCNISYSDNYIGDEETLYSCKDVFGSHSVDASNGKCVCESGYQWSTDKKSCTPSAAYNQSGHGTSPSSCGMNSYPTVNGKCSCNPGYSWKYPDDPNNYDCTKVTNATNSVPSASTGNLASQQTQESGSNNCQNKLGAGSYSSANGTCLCKAGFSYNYKRTSCIDGKTRDAALKEFNKLKNAYAKYPYTVRIEKYEKYIKMLETAKNLTSEKVLLFSEIRERIRNEIESIRKLMK